MNPANLTPEQLIAAAESLEAQAQLLRELARLRAGSNVQRHATLPDNMTGAQILQRGAAIALRRAHDSQDALQLAATKSRWKSVRQWAKYLKVSPGSISGYAAGDRPTPPRIWKAAEKDLGVPRTYWRGGIIE